ncbi:MAG: methyltransferase domain-containing protein [Herminiimonas sp.]|nr:methyltransferase domain-containing protein [Herminiimonas sp.]
MTVHTDLQAYYAQRAATYDELYARSERQADLVQLQRRVGELLAGQRVLELACGTGYWTSAIAATADHVLATDINREMLEIARTRGLPADKATFAIGDANAPPQANDCTACLAGLWWSHVARSRQPAFLTGLQQALQPQAQLILIDSVYVEGNSTPIARTDAEGNTYQIRRLPDGERHEVLKNFPTDSNLRKRVADHLKDIRIERLEYFWLLSGRFK